MQMQVPNVLCYAVERRAIDTGLYSGILEIKSNSCSPKTVQSHGLLSKLRSYSDAELKETWAGESSGSTPECSR